MKKEVKIGLIGIVAIALLIFGINYLKGVLGAKVACFFYEKTETDVKGSFRGNDGYDVCALAQKFGGGGHVKAAGCTITAPIAEAKAMVLKEVEKML